MEGPTMKSLAKLLFVLPALFLAAPASADSPATSTNVPSRTAAHVAPAPYTGAATTPAQAKQVVTRALAAVKKTNASPTVGLAVAQRVDSVDMDHPGTTDAFKAGLTRMKRQSSDPAVDARLGLIRGATTAIRNPDDTYAQRQVNQAARELPADPRVQAVAGVVSAQRASMGKGAEWDKKSPLWTQAAARFKAAEAAKPNALTRGTLQSAGEYLQAYPGFQKADAPKPIMETGGIAGPVGSPTPDQVKAGKPQMETGGVAGPVGSPTPDQVKPAAAK
jgi:hypothetical protein